MRKHLLAALAALVASLGVAQDEAPTISVVIGASSGVDSVRDAARAYMEAHPDVTVEVIEGPERTDDLLAVYQDYFDGGEGADVLTLDVIWPGDLGEFMLDLYAFDGYREAAGEHFPSIVENNTTLDGRLLAIPWFTDVGLLYYRSDLLADAGFEAPPATWGELEAMAAAVQERVRGERGDDSFWGFVFQGDEYEGLTVDALEWIASSGGGTFIDGDGTITVDNPAAAAALDRAAGWIGAIAPPGVIGFGEEESRNLWQAGDAAFMRNWPYAFALGNAPGSPIAGRFDVAPLPAGEGGERAAGLGGWGLGVASYSPHPEIAADFALFLSSREQQKRRAVEGSFAPTHPDLYDDAEVLAAQPFFADLRASVESAVARPAAATSPRYTEATRAIYRAVHSVLTGEREASEALEVLEADLEEITGLRAAP